MDSDSQELWLSGGGGGSLCYQQEAKCPRGLFGIASMKGSMGQIWCLENAGKKQWSLGCLLYTWSVMNRVYFPVHPRSSSGDRVAVPRLENHENKMTWVLRAYHLPVRGASGAAGSICLSFLSPEFLHHLWYPVPPRWRTDLPCNPPEGEWCPGGLGRWAGVGIPS